MGTPGAISNRVRPKVKVPCLTFAISHVHLRFEKVDEAGYVTEILPILLEVMENKVSLLQAKPIDLLLPALEA